jgi:ribose-phosphate pyrophosphokinase
MTKSSSSGTTAADFAAQLTQMAMRGQVDRPFVAALGQQLVALAGRQPALVFAIPGYERLAQEIVAASNGWFELGVDERKRHADGKGWQRFVTSVKGREVLLVGGTMSDTDQMELYKLGYNAWLWKAHKLTFLIPYHGDARQERAQSEGEAVDGLFASMMFAKIPSCPGGNDVFLVDIHADAVTGFFLGAGMRCVNIEVLNQLIESIAGERYAGKCMVAAPDAGRGKVVSKTAKALGLRFAIASKSRPKKPGAKPETAGLIGHVRGRNVILSDDMGVSFSSAIGAGEFLRQKGAADVVLAITHGVIPDEQYVQTLIDSKIFSCMYVTDSMPRVYALKKKFPDFINIVPLAPLVVPHLLG